MRLPLKRFYIYAGHCVAGHGRARAKHHKPLRIRPVPGPSIPVEPDENQGQTLFLESYKDVQGHHSSYNVIPGQ